MSDLDAKFILLGHDSPLGGYPAIVVPVGSMGGQLMVSYTSSKGPHLVPVPNESIFVKHSPETTEGLSQFDHERHGLFAFNAQSLVVYSLGAEKEFFAKLFKTEDLGALDPFYRFSLARKAQAPELVARAFDQCVQLLQANSPQFAGEWIRKNRPQLPPSNLLYAEALSKSPTEDITVLLHRWHEGDQAMGEELFRRVMPELQRIAARLRGRERSSFSLQRTELVNEIYLKLLDANYAIDWQDRGHFFAIYTIKLRRFLIDRARAKPTAELLSVEEVPEGKMAGRNRLEVRLAVDQLLEQMEKELPVTCGILVAKTYFGYEVKEIMENFNLSQRTVERHLYVGRKWLFERLS